MDFDLPLDKQSHEAIYILFLRPLRRNGFMAW